MKEWGACLEFTSQGLWPGPGEELASFLLRAKEQIKRLDKGISPALAPFSTNTVYGFDPVYIPIVFEDRGLAMWEGAALFMEEGAFGRVAEVRVKSCFAKKGNFLFCSLGEVAAHEYLHAARVAYDEPVFEEILAYRSSPAKIRQYLGPFVRSPSQLYVFITFASLAFLFDVIASICTAVPYLMLPLVVTGFTLWGFIRLAYLQKTFSKALKALKKLIKPGASPLTAIARLTDKEIFSLARGKEDMKRYFKVKGLLELRLALFCHEFLQG